MEPMKYEGEVQMMPGRVLIKQKSTEEMTEGGIVLPDVSKKKLNEGTVVRAGPTMEENWSPDAPTVHGGEHVLFAPMGGVEVEIAGEKFLVVSHHDIFMILG